MEFLKSLFGYGNQPTGTSTPGTFENYGNWANMNQLKTSDPLGGFMVDKNILSLPTGVDPQKSFMDGMLGKDGWGGLALGAAQGIGSAFLGMKQYGLAKDALKHNKNMFNKNYEAQRKTTNTQMADRQRARVASNPGAYQSVGEYMKENEVV